MRPFCARDGYLHFLFAEEDDYYLDSLVRLDLKQYLYYCLKQEGYQAVYFLDGTGKRLQICTLDLPSMEEFQRTGARGIKLLFAQPFKQSRIWEHGHALYEAGLPACEDWYEGLRVLLGKKQDANAFVIPIHLFFQLYQDAGRAEELAEQLAAERQGSILVVLAPSCAEGSMDDLLAESGPFCSRLCPEVLRITGKAKKVLLYEEMERELAGRYQVWNQLEREDILRMLRYGVLIENKPWPSGEDRLQDAATLIYFRYHSPLFAAECGDFLPELSERRLRAVRAALASPEVWRRLEEQRTRLRRQARAKEGSGSLEEASSERPLAERPLADILGPDYPLTGRFHPQRRQSAALRRLRGVSVSRLMGESQTPRCRQAGVRLTAVWKDMHRVYSTVGNDREDEWLEFCLDSFGELETDGQDACATERILDFLEYLVIKDERLRRPELFARKTECYRQIIELSLEIVRQRRTVREYEERSRESRSRRDALLREVLRIERERPELAREAEAVSAGPGKLSFSGAYLALSAKKEELLRLDEECRNQERFAAELVSRITLYQKAISQLELSIDQLAGDNLTELSETLRGAVRAVQSREMARIARAVLKEQETGEECDAEYRN